jgi:hypothetical protein
MMPRSPMAIRKFDGTVKKPRTLETVKNICVL